MFGMVLFWGGREGIVWSPFSILPSAAVQRASKGFPSTVALSTFLPSVSTLKEDLDMLFFKAFSTKGSMKTHGKELAAHSFRVGALGFFFIFSLF